MDGHVDTGIAHEQPADWDFWRNGLDRKFFGRVYLRSTQITMVLALIFLGFEQRPIALGLMAGMVVGLASLWTVEMTVRLLFNGGKMAGVKLAIGACAKLPFLLAGLFGIAWAAEGGWMNVFAVVCGLLLVHGTILVMTVTTAIANQDTVRERYR